MKNEILSSTPRSASCRSIIPWSRAYTRASDSVLCVPLMVDAAVWCDYFSRKSWSYENVAKALAYLFKVPEGAGKGVDPGFFRQMQELEILLICCFHFMHTLGPSRNDIQMCMHPSTLYHFHSYTSWRR